MKELFKSLGAFRIECPIIHKGTQGYGYSYTSLPDVIQVINPLLDKHGLGFTQYVEGNQLVTIIYHAESGESIKASADIPSATLKGMNEYQVLGSAITYLRRYQLSSMLGIVTDKDTDAASPQAKPAPPKPKAPLNIGDDNYTRLMELVIKKSDKVPTITAIKKAYTLSSDVEKDLLSKGLKP